METTAEPEVIGRYAIYDKIASGGMASVYFGRLQGSAGFARTVAIKRLHPHLAEDPQFVATMVDEARLAARIHHPNVVPTLDVLADGSRLLVVMEYIRGEALSRLLAAERARSRFVPLSIASAIAVGALHGLHAAHEATDDQGAPLGIVHRDISPQNILVGLDGQARVIDFGVAKAAGRLQTTRDGSIKGKIPYMAPEQLSSGVVTRHGDVYATAVVLWEMLAGRRLFPAMEEVLLLGQVLSGVRDRPSRYNPEITPALDAVVMRGLASRQELRFASAREMADALMDAQQPAFPPEVGAWVEETAGEALTRRRITLAGIEGGVGIPPGPPLAVDDFHTTVSQPSSVSLETPRPSGRPPVGSTRMRTVGAVLALVVVVAAVAIVAWRAGARAAGSAPAGSAGSAAPAAQSPPGPAAPAQVASAPQPRPVPAEGAPEPAPSASVAPIRPPATPTPTRPGHAHGPRPPPKREPDPLAP